VDAYPGDVDGEGDPVSLAVQRTSTFTRRKILLVSTPTIQGLSRIEQEFEVSDKRYFHVPCPFCGNYQMLVWANPQVEQWWTTSIPENYRKKTSSSREKGEIRVQNAGLTVGDRSGYSFKARRLASKKSRNASCPTGSFPI
jgi:phage terminase large subunit GpA-like protein